MKENEKKKVYLEQYLELKYETDQLFEEVEYWHEKAYMISAFQLDNFGIHGSPKRGQPIDTLWDIYRQCRSKARFTYKKQLKIRDAIDCVNKSVYRMVLKMKYIQGYNLKDADA